MRYYEVLRMPYIPKLTDRYQVTMDSLVALTASVLPENWLMFVRPISK